MKSNTELQRDVLEELNWAPSISSGEIGVTARDGVITLTGEVPSYFEKIEAEDVAGRVAGVMAIAEELTVKLPSYNERTDTDIAQAALNALAWNVGVPRDAAQVRVENGWITLTGQVESHYQQMAAANAVHHLMGVKGVTNSITIELKAASTADEIKRTIEGAFKRAAVLDAQKIAVFVEGGRVTLKGVTNTWSEKNAAREYAWAAPGVSSVENDIVVLN